MIDNTPGIPIENKGNSYKQVVSLLHSKGVHWIHFY